MLWASQPDLALKVIEMLQGDIINSRLHLTYLISKSVYVRWQGDNTQSGKLLEQARELAATLGLIDQEWRLHLELANIYKGTGEVELASSHRVAARVILDSLAVKITGERYRQSFEAWLLRLQE